MPKRSYRLATDSPEIVAAFAELRRQLKVSVQFPAEVLVEAEAAAHAPRLPNADETAIPFVTLDPASSMDLDQAFHIERRGDGYRVRYAIADVAAFVRPGGPLDVEAHQRGETLYAPDENARLYPPVLSEGAASLLPDQTRPAVVWTMDVDETGEGVDVNVRHALVRSRAKLDYVSAQQALDGGTADEQLRLLREVGLLRQQREIRRGGVSLAIPEQVITQDDDQYWLQFRAPLPVEGWNAQMSLMTGMAAADLMLEGGVGLLRTVPLADPDRLRRLRLTAEALRVEWPEDVAVPRVRPQPEPVHRAPGGAPARGGEPPPRVELHVVRGRPARAADALGARLDVRAHDRAAPPARRPVRRRGVHRAVGGA